MSRAPYQMFCAAVLSLAGLGGLFLAGPAVGQPPAGNTVLTRQTLPEMLRAAGFDVKIEPEVNGKPSWSVTHPASGKQVGFFPVIVQGDKLFGLILGCEVPMPGKLGANDLQNASAKLAPYKVFQALPDKLAMTYVFTGAHSNPQQLKMMVDNLIARASEADQLLNGGSGTKSGPVPPVPNPPQPPAQPNDLAGTTWKGSENPGSGVQELQIQFLAGGKAVITMGEAKANGSYTVKGNQVMIQTSEKTTYNGNQVTIQASEITYQGTMNGEVISGKGQDESKKIGLESIEGKKNSWAFSVIQLSAPVPANPLASTTWKGSENAKGFGKLEFRFEAGGSVLKTDANGTQSGTYTVQANQVTIQVAGITYQGTMTGEVISGKGQTKETWTFSVIQSK